MQRSRVWRRFGEEISGLTRAMHVSEHMIVEIHGIAQGGLAQLTRRR